MTKVQALLAVAICCGLSLTGYADLVGLWRFEEGTGTTTADSSGNGNDGVLTGPNISWTTGKYGNAINVANDGINVSYVDVVSTDPRLLIGQTAADSWTIAVWAQEISSSGNYVATYGRMMVLDVAPPTCMFQLESGATGDDQIYIWSDYNGAYRIGTGLAQVLDQWVYYAVVYDGSTGNLTLYRDANRGANGAKRTFSVNSPLRNSVNGAGAVRVGSQNSTIPSRQWHGKLDDVAIWNQALTEAQIAEVMAGNMGPFPLLPTNPNPLDGASYVDLDAKLSWTAGTNTIESDVYFGTDETAVINATDPNTLPGRGRQTETTYDPGGMQLENTYYWRIDGVGTSETVKGAVWHFTTLPDGPCGTWGYDYGDLDHDCYVNLEDLAIMASGWLDCTLPGEIGCKSGSGSFGSGKTKGTATFLVAASDSSAEIKNNADYVCDGLNDEIQIQAAIDTLPVDGGRVVLSAGNFQLGSNPIQIARSDIILEGQGPGSILQSLTATCSGGGSPTGSHPECGYIVIGDGNNYFESVTIKNLLVDAESATNFGGITIRGSPANHIANITVENCWVRNADIDGIYAEFADHTNILNCRTWSTGRTGIFVDICRRTTIHACHVKDPGSLTGIRSLRSEYTVMSGNHVEDLGASRAVVGMIICCGKRCTMIGNTVEGSLHCFSTGGYYDVLEYSSIIGNHARGATYSGLWLCGSPTYYNAAITLAHNTASDCGEDGIRIGTSHGWMHGGQIVGARIVDNICWHNGGYGINLDPGSGLIADTTIIGNDFTGNTMGAANGLANDSTCILKDNAGYNPVGVSSIIVDASPFTYTAGSSSETVYISGGDVVSITKNGTNLGLVTGMFELEPHEDIVITYNTTPTIIKDVH